MLNMLLSTDAVAQPDGMSSLISMLTMFVPLILIMYFLMIRPQRKRDKAIQEMRSKIEVGDEVVTAGGIIGRVVSIREDSLVIESGSDRSKIRIARWAIQSNNTVHDSTETAEK